MRFVKATERLPESDDTLHVKIDGIRKMGNFYDDEDGNKWFYVIATSRTNDWHIPQHKFEGIEWLDEQDEGWVPVEGARIIEEPEDMEWDSRRDYLTWPNKKVSKFYQGYFWHTKNGINVKISPTHYRPFPEPPATT